MSRFPLAGAHQQVNCASCHANGVYAGTRQDCYGCHAGNYAATKNPDHTRSAFPTNCADCHTTAGWPGARFDHALARFQLTGAHVQAACTQCHAGGQFTGHELALRWVPPGGLQQGGESEPRYRGFHPGVRLLPHDRPLDWRLLRPRQQDPVHPHRRPRAGELHSVPRGRPLRGDRQPVRRDATSATTRKPPIPITSPPDSRRTALPVIRRHSGPGRRLTTTRRRGSPSPARTCSPPAPSVTRGAVRRDALRLRRVPLDELPEDGQPQPCRCRVLARLRVVPHHRPVDRRGFRPQPDEVHVDRRAHAGRLRAVPRGGPLRRDGAPSASGATWPPSRGRPIRTTSRPGFRRTAPPATPRLAGRGRSSTTARTKFTLTGAHTQVACAQCHVGGKFAGTATDCVGCHLATFQKTTNPNHVAAGFPQDCTTCHTTARWTGAAFDHTARTRFTLTGAHAQVACAQCHVGGKFAGTADRLRRMPPRHFPADHQPEPRQRGFPAGLAPRVTPRPAGRERPSITPHGRGSRSPARTHRSLARSATWEASSPARPRTASAATWRPSRGPPTRTTSPPGFPQTCATCHTTARWTGATFDHTARTRFTLTGAHAQVACAQCHVGGKFAGTPPDCVGCHLADLPEDHQSEPRHRPDSRRTCTTCHTTARLDGSGLRSRRTDAVPAHRRARAGRLRAVPRGRQVRRHAYGLRRAATSPTSRRPPTRTTSPPDSRRPARPATPRPAGRRGLRSHRPDEVPAHRRAHRRSPARSATWEQVRGHPTDCVGCHLTTFQKTTNPNHVAAGFPQTCATCHTTARWTGATFDHTRARVPAHRRARAGRLRAVPRRGRSRRHAHRLLGLPPRHFPEDHQSQPRRRRLPADLRHLPHHHELAGRDLQPHHGTKFPLTGAHVPVACAQCHVGGRFAGTPTDCVGLPPRDFQRTTNPNHVAAGFPQTCATCHTTAALDGGHLQPHAGTSFPLTGAHVQVACAQCHVGGRFAGTPTVCSGCHLATFQKTTNPNHVTAGFPQTCDTCHTTTALEAATFDHASTQVSPHRCPRHGGLRPVPREQAGSPARHGLCRAATSRPSRRPPTPTTSRPASRRPATPATPPPSWTGATFNHSTATRFPLTGAHVRSRARSATSRQRLRGHPTVCVGCHLTNFQKTTNPNHVTAGFPQTCDTCHTTTALDGPPPSTTPPHQLPARRRTRAGRLRAVPRRATSSPARPRSAPAATSPISRRPPTPTTQPPGSRRPAKPATPPPRGRAATFNHNTATTLPADRRARRGRLRACHVNNVFAGTSTVCSGCHLTDFPEDHQPQPRDRRFPADLRNLPHHGGLAPGNLRPLQDAVPAHRRSRLGGLRRLPRQQVYAGLRTTCVGLPPGTTSTPLPARTTRPPASRRTAPSATPPPRGPGPPSTTRPPSSRSPAGIPPWRARHATSIMFSPAWARPARTAT